MAHSLEARLPFLDHELFELARRIPVHAKMRNNLEKAVLREAAKGILPDDVRLRRKTGFMLTTDAVDLFGSDREATESLKPYLSKRAFEDAQLFSYRTYLVMRALARMPSWGSLKRLRRNANKVILYMMQAHMLHHMFVADPRWRKAKLPMKGDEAKAPQAHEFVA
jgi:asparagine synthase (glutamine-hydrolysing)